MMIMNVEIVALVVAVHAQVRAAKLAQTQVLQILVQIRTVLIARLHAKGLALIPA